MQKARSVVLVIAFLAILALIRFPPYVGDWLRDVFAFIPILIGTAIGTGSAAAAAVGTLPTVLTALAAIGVGALGVGAAAAGGTVLVLNIVKVTEVAKKNKWATIEPVIGVLGYYTTDVLAQAAGIESPHSTAIAAVGGLLIFAGGLLIQSRVRLAAVLGAVVVLLVPAFIVIQLMLSEPLTSLGQRFASTAPGFVLVLILGGISVVLSLVLREPNGREQAIR